MPDVSSVKPPEFLLRVSVSFGHCDPAGIVYYPNHYRWFDRCFHTFLQERSAGHAWVCEQLNSVGIGLMDSGARFFAPVKEGDELRLEMFVEEWTEKALRLKYRGWVADRLAVEGHEVRGVFVQEGGRMRGAPVEGLRRLLERQDGT